MRFFSKLVFICNTCFILSFAIRLLKTTRSINSHGDALVYQPLEGTIAVLGLLVAIILNAFFILLCAYWVATKKIKLIPLWIVLFNILIFPCQVYYQFVAK